MTIPDIRKDGIDNAAAMEANQHILWKHRQHDAFEKSMEEGE